jgi:hypothetical protein
MVEERADTDEKETEDEAQDEKLVLLSSSQPHPPLIPSFLPTTTLSIIHSLHISETDPLSPSDSKLGSEVQTLLPPSSSSQSTLASGDVSQSTTPPQLPTRKTPSHQPKLWFSISMRL